MVNNNPFFDAMNAFMQNGVSNKASCFDAEQCVNAQREGADVVARMGKTAAAAAQAMMGLQVEACQKGAAAMMNLAKEPTNHEHVTKQASKMLKECMNNTEEMLEIAAKAGMDMFRDAARGMEQMFAQPQKAASKRR